MPKHLEDAEQAALFDWAAHYALLDWMHAIPNGGKRNPREAARLKKQGVKSGVFDIFLPLVIPPYPGLYIEMKRSEGRTRVTDNQRSFQAAMEIQGYKCVVCKGTEEAIAAIKEYAKL